jgi:hypothetical protein
MRFSQLFPDDGNQVTRFVRYNRSLDGLNAIAWENGETIVDIRLNRNQMKNYSSAHLTIPRRQFQHRQFIMQTTPRLKYERAVPFTISHARSTIYFLQFFSCREWVTAEDSSSACFISSQF